MTDEPTGDRGSDGQSSDDEESSWAERLLVAVSAGFTLLLLSYVVWQSMMIPVTAEPTATITETESLSSGDLKVTVELRNAQYVGLVMATVEVDCATPPPEITFEHVPADDRRTGFVVCPSGTQQPNVTVSTWTEA